mmetsp:Transcript_17642/g.40735  ORF Transcript_17642/g.40735 Transcript_17642/m.40735 type:complete len:296 (-) Transcript_17642:1012-1899(-)
MCENSFERDGNASLQTLHTCSPTPPSSAIFAFAASSAFCLRASFAFFPVSFFGVSAFWSSAFASLPASRSSHPCAIKKPKAASRSPHSLTAKLARSPENPISTSCWIICSTAPGSSPTGCASLLEKACASSHPDSDSPSSSSSEDRTAAGPLLPFALFCFFSRALASWAKTLSSPSSSSPFSSSPSLSEFTSCFAPVAAPAASLSSLFSSSSSCDKNTACRPLFFFLFFFSLAFASCARTLSSSSPLSSPPSSWLSSTLPSASSSILSSSLSSFPAAAALPLLAFSLAAFFWAIA